MGRIQILSVVWYRVLPPKFGGQKGIAEFNAFLSELIPLHCLCSSDNAANGVSYSVENKLPIGKQQVINPMNWWKILITAKRVKASHIIIEHCYYSVAGMLACRLLGIPWILHEHNIEYLRFKAMNRWWWPVLKQLESRACRSASLVMFKTEADKQHAIRHFRMDPDKSIIVPFGITRSDRPTDEEKNLAARDIRQLHGISEQSKILLFSGTLDYEPNARAFRRIVQDIIPLLEQQITDTFIVIVSGRLRAPEFADLHSLKHPNFLFVGEVDDVSPYLMGADVFINPVDTGGGIKVKTMEALSYDLPVVSTEHSATGIDLTVTGQKLKVCPDGDIHAFCGLICDVLKDKSHIPHTYFVHYQWRHLIGKVAEEIKKLRN